MKKLIVLSHGWVTGQNLAEELHKIFGKFVTIESYSSEEKLPDDFSDHLILITTDAVLSGPLKSYVKESPKSIMAQRVINYKYLKPVIELAAGTEVLLVNDHERTTMVAIEQLKGLGLNHVTYVPYYPGCRMDKAYDVAVTPGEPHLVPASVKKVIDIHTRQIDLTTIIEVAEKLGLLEDLKSTLSSQYLSDFIELLKELDEKANEAESLQNTFMTLADHSNDGIVYTAASGRIVLANKFARRYFPDIELTNENIFDVIPVLRDKKFNDEERDIIRLNKREVFVSVKHVQEDIKKNTKNEELIYVFEDVSELRKLEYEVRRKSRKEEHVALYDFDRILYKSPAMDKTIRLAKKIAHSDATVLIEGESGTGKELLAQAIHLQSHRSEGPFVPVNFAAMPLSLLESELFGYEEGAFTGAQKGGKPGLFEEAHGGTMFLDEIGDAPLEFQVRLLRVLQEKQIRRLGGRKQIPINIRVIVATNRDLIKAVKSGAFREDLFYRLSVFPLRVEALRNRKEDILYLMEHYLKTINNNNKLKLEEFMSAACINYLKGYNWPGNIRQLMNVIEYLSNIKESNKFIEITDLPVYMQVEKTNEEENILMELLGDDFVWLLRQIDHHGHIGRRQLSEIAKKEKRNLSEGNIRSLLKKGEELSLIQQNQGRKGSALTNRGMRVIGW